MKARMLTKNFAEHEFRCRCGCGSLSVSETLLNALEKLRLLVERPIHILSGCRCWEHNHLSGGALKSQHLCEDHDGKAIDTRAADIYIAGVRPRQMFRAAMQVDEFRGGGIGIYEGQGFIHVDVRGIRARWFVESKGAPVLGIPRNYY